MPPRMDINDIRFFGILMMCANIKMQVYAHLQLRLAKIGEYIQNGHQMIKSVKKNYIGHKHSLIYD